jgi:hypothetical protein
MIIENADRNARRSFPTLLLSNEGNPREPVHIHVRRGGALAKFWLHPVTVADSYGFDSSTLAYLADVIDENATRIERAWDEHFGE